MGRMKKSVDLTVGGAVSNDEAESKPDKIGAGQATPSDDPEVVGRCFTYEHVMCPTCGAINYVYVDDEVYNWYRCWNTKNGTHYFRV